jgi:hypothetical protein
MKTRKGNGTSIPSLLVRFSLPVAAGAVLGYLVFYPLSVVIIYLFERQFFNAQAILTEAFMGGHLSLGLYFALIGAGVGAVFAAFRRRMHRVNIALTEMNRALQRRNRELLEKLKAGAGEEELVEDVRVTLDKINKGIDLILSGGLGQVTERQTQLLDVTRDNIDDLTTALEKSVQARNGPVSVAERPQGGGSETRPSANG